MKQYNHKLKKILCLPQNYNLIEESADQKGIVYHIKKKIESSKCPICDSRNWLDGTRKRKMLHVKINERFISIKLIVQKYECSVCHHKSEEDYGDFVKKYYRISNEYARFLLNIFTEMRSFKAICKEYKISFNLANKLTRILVAVNNRANLITLPKHIGIDEFKGNLYKGYQKYQVQVTDLDTGDIIAVLKNKDSNTLANFFKQITNRDKVESVSIDFCSPFKKVVSKYFPHSKLIPDAFHRSKLLLSAVDEFRVELWRNYKSNKEYAKYFKG